MTVRDVCCGGLGLEYVVGAQPIEPSLVLDLISWECGPVTVSALVCRTVYDVPSLSENRSFKGVQTRKRGVAFVAPTLRQKRQLDLVLRRLEPL